MRLIDERPQNRHLIHDPETQRRRATKHGYSKEPWYTSYKNMMQRCYLPSNPNFPIYGGRGIKVCDEWLNIENFATWVSESGYERGLTIERKDPNKDYCPDNCTWATPREQANNRRNTLMLEHNGITLPLADWAERLGINRHTLWSRIKKQGWSVDKALSEGVTNS